MERHGTFNYERLPYSVSLGDLGRRGYGAAIGDAHQVPTVLEAASHILAFYQNFGLTILLELGCLSV